MSLGFIEETRHGGLSRKTRIASEWRMTAFKCDLTGAFKSVLFMQRGELARGHRLLRSRPQTGRREPVRLSQNVTEPVSIDARECLKRRHSLYQSTVDNSPECLKRRSVEATLGGQPVSNDGTHIVYQVGTVPEPTPQALTAHPDIEAPAIKLVWSKPVVRELFGAEAIMRRAEVMSQSVH